MLELNFVLFFFIFFVSSLILVRRMPIASYRSVNGKKRARNLFAHSGCVDVYQGTTLFCIRKIFFFFWSIWSIDITKSSLRKNFNRMKERFSIVSSISCVVVVRAHPSDRAKLQIVMIKVKNFMHSFMDFSTWFSSLCSKSWCRFNDKICAMGFKLYTQTHRLQRRFSLAKVRKRWKERRESCIFHRLRLFFRLILCISSVEYFFFFRCHSLLNICANTIAEERQDIKMH